MPELLAAATVSVAKKAKRPAGSAFSLHAGQQARHALTGVQPYCVQAAVVEVIAVLNDSSQQVVGRVVPIWQVQLHLHVR